MKSHLDSRLNSRWTQRFTKQKFASATRTLAPTVLALTLATAAHAQGTIDFSGANSVMTSFKTFALFAGAIICFGGLIFAGIRMMSGRFQDAIPGLFGALFGAGVLGWGAGWISYTQEYLEASSVRSQQIRQHLERSGHTSAAAAQIAAHATRDSKQLLTPKEVLAAHKELAAEHGNQAERVIAEARERSRTQHLAPDGSAVARQAVTYARESNFEREAVTDERVLMRDALRRGMGEATFTDVRAEFERRRSQGDFLEMARSKHATGRSFTTGDTIAQERANVAHVLSGRNSFAAIVTQEKAREQTASRGFLNLSQRTAIEEVLTSRDRVQGVQGLAGTGKTTALAVIREGAEQNGYAVEGFAPTSRAAAQLREAGIGAPTLQSFLARGEQGQRAGDSASRHLYMLDESSLASTKQMRAFLDKIQPQDRVLVIGDTRQHQAVEAGKPFEQMQDAGMRTSQLDQIVRQRDPELLKAVEQLARGETAAGVALLANQGRVTEVANPQQRVEAIARDYAARPENTIIVSPDNRSRQEINQAVRVELSANGILSPDERTFQTLSHRSDMTGPDRAWAARYQPSNTRPAAGSMGSRGAAPLPCSRLMPARTPSRFSARMAWPSPTIQSGFAASMLSK